MVRSEREESVEVLRGIAAVLVMWFHLTNGNDTFLPEGSLLKTSGAYGYLGVQIFFVISGFIIPFSLSLRSYQFCADGLGFLCRRVVRIEPAYLVSVVLIAVLQVVSALTPASHAAMPDQELARSMLLHFAYLVPWFDIPWLSPVYWSLAIEFQYYISMLFFASFLLSRRRVSVYSFLLVSAALPLLEHDARTLFPYLPLFGLGFVRYLAFRRILSFAELAMWATVFLGLCWFVLDSRQTFVAAFAFGFLFLPLNRPVPVLSFLGAISYSLYLVHVPIGGRIVNLATRLPATTILQCAAIIFAVGCSIIGAYCFWRLVERPSARLSKSIGSQPLLQDETKAVGNKPPFAPLQ
jgi:peptidoglycan/LPS O-acetylase OafA/YrhL